MLNDIITEHKERMLNLKKYYPFFKLMDVSFAQFQEGRYEMLDMGYIVMGILRFLLRRITLKKRTSLTRNIWTLLHHCSNGTLG